MTDNGGRQGRSDDPQWDAFLEGHRTEMEDALLPTLAQAQGAGAIPASPLVQLTLTHDEMRRVAKVRGITVGYPDGEPPSGTPMKIVTFTSPIDGKQVEVPMPAQVGPKGMRISVNGIEALMFPDPEPTAEATDEDEWEVEQAIRAALDVHAQQLKHEGGVGLFALAIKDELRDELIEAWAHYEDHGCAAAAAMLDRIVLQLRDAFLEAKGGA